MSCVTFKTAYGFAISILPSEEMENNSWMVFHPTTIDLCQLLGS